MDDYGCRIVHIGSFLFYHPYLLGNEWTFEFEGLKHRHVKLPGNAAGSRSHHEDFFLGDQGCYVLMLTGQTHGFETSCLDNVTAATILTLMVLSGSRH